ncbi:ATP-binding cassette domain-containing protein [Mycoplasmopsis agassizii]|uniref:ATP-binding cassette domain-containing protein n=1 Tax=Mycoplasmopsis agassizii TaxID=33922 RepID=UPI003527E3CD
MKSLQYHRNALYYLKVNFWYSFVTFLIVAISASLGAISPLFLTQLLTEILASPNDLNQQVVTWLVVSILGWVFFVIFSILNQVMIRKLRIKMQKSIKDDFQNYISRISANDFKKIGSGTFFNWFNTDIVNLSKAYTSFYDIVSAVVAIISIVLTFVFIPSSNVIIAGAFILGLFVISIVPFFFAKMNKREVANQSKTYDRFFINVSKLLENLKYLRINFYLNKVINKVSASNHDLFKADIKKDYVKLISDTVADITYSIYLILFMGLVLGLIYIGNTTSNLPVYLIPGIALMSTIDNIFTSGKSEVLTLSNTYIQIKSRAAIINKWKEEFSKLEIQDEANKIEIKSISFENFKSPFVKTNKYSEFNFKLDDQVRKILILGRNGIGKSTILNSILKINQDYSGSIKINDQDILKISSETIYKNLSYIDSHNVVFDISIDENIALDFESQNQNKITVVKTVSKVDFELEKDQLASSLSTGQIQRIDIARNLYRGNKILLLDEAFANIDKKRAIEIEESLLANKEIRMINISHNISDELADKYDLVLKL